MLTKYYSLLKYTTALCLKKQCTYLNEKLLYGQKMLTII